MFLKIHYILLYIQLFLQETGWNIYLVPHILLIDVYDWKGGAVKAILKMKFVALKILKHGETRPMHLEKLGSRSGPYKCHICVTVCEGTPESRR